MAFRWWANDGPFIVAFASSLPSSTKKKKRKPLSKSPSGKTSWIHAMHISGFFLFKDIYLEYCLSPRDNSFKLAQHVLVNRSLTLFQLFTLIVVCSLFWVYTLVAYIANNIPRSDCSWGRLIWVHIACFHVKTSLKCICIYAVGIKGR